MFTSGIVNRNATQNFTNQFNNSSQMYHSSHGNKKSSSKKLNKVKTIEEAENQMLNKVTEERDSRVPTENNKENSKLLEKLKKSKPIIGVLNRLLFKEKLKNLEVNNYKRTKKSEFLYYQYMGNTLFQCIFSFSSIVSAVVNYETEYQSKSELVVNLTNWLCFITSICLWATIIYEYFMSCKILSSRYNIPKKMWARESGNVFTLILGLIIFLLHPNPAFKGINVKIYNDKYQVYATHSLNSIFSVFCLLRMWYFVKFYLVYSSYYSPRSQRVCSMNGFNTSLHFSMKANMTKTPYHAYILLFLIILLYCSFCLRIFERVLDEPSGSNFSSYWNTLWCLIITMTTVGYGDFTPSSTLGRFIGIIACICGVFLISMLIVTITNVLEFQGTEQSVFLILQRLKLAKEKDQLAASLISKYIKLLKYLKCSSENPEKILIERKALREEIVLGLHYLKEKNKEIESTFPAYSNFDNIIDNLNILDKSVTDLNTKYENMEKNMQELIKNLD
jgi:potassium intermediate/small conductance calcium-activated channel subfamily N protein 2